MWDNKYRLIATLVLLSLPAVATAGDSDEAPSEELLEFLGEFQTQDGEWFDPLDLLEVKQSDLRQNETNASEITQSDIKQTELKRNNEDQSDE
jgi:hypothetical protein